MAIEYNTPKIFQLLLSRQDIDTNIDAILNIEFNIILKLLFNVYPVIDFIFIYNSNQKTLIMFKIIY